MKYEGYSRIHINNTIIIIVDKVRQNNTEQNKRQNSVVK